MKTNDEAGSIVVNMPSPGRVAGPPELDGDLVLFLIISIRIMTRSQIGPAA